MKKQHPSPSKSEFQVNDKTSKNNSEDMMNMKVSIIEREHIRICLNIIQQYNLSMLI